MNYLGAFFPVVPSQSVCAQKMYSQAPDPKSSCDCNIGHSQKSHCGDKHNLNILNSLPRLCDQKESLGI